MDTNLEQIKESLVKIEEKLEACILSNMRNSISAKTSSEMDLREIWKVVCDRKRVIISLAIIFSVIALVYSLVQPNIYESHALLVPSDESKGGGLSALGGQFGGLASLAGINLHMGGNDKTEVALEVLRSREFLKEVIEKYELTEELRKIKGWGGKGDMSAQSEFSDWDQYKVFLNILSVARNKNTGFVNVAIQHPSPEAAKQWVDMLVSEINSVMREKDVVEATKSIEYLKQQLKRTSVAEMQSVFFQLIEEQTKIMMLAEVRDEYVFTTLDPAVVPEEKTKPKRALICIFGFLFGVVFGAFLSLGEKFFRSSYSQD